MFARFSRKSLATVAGALAVVLVQAPAAAETLTVGHGDLDLSTAAARKQLDIRIRQAADSLCVRELDFSVIAQARRYRCRHELVASVRPQVEQAIARAGMQVASAPEAAVNATH